MISTIRFILLYILQKRRIVVFPLPLSEPSISESSNMKITVLHLHVSIVTKNRTNQTLALVLHIFSRRHRGGWNTGSSAGCITKPHHNYMPLNPTHSLSKQNRRCLLKVCVGAGKRWHTGASGWGAKPRPSGGTNPRSLFRFCSNLEPFTDGARTPKLLFNSKD